MTSDSSLNLKALATDLESEFGFSAPIKRLVAWRMPVSRSAKATIFFNHKNQLFIHITTPARQTLGDVRKVLFQVGLIAYKYLPPAGRPDYFVEIASEYFNKTYPSRKIVSDNDLRYFKTLALYNPALVQIKNVKDGVIKCFDPDAKGEWRVFCKLTYSRLDDFKLT